MITNDPTSPDSTSPDSTSILFEDPELKYAMRRFPSNLSPNLHKLVGVLKLVSQQHGPALFTAKDAVKWIHQATNYEPSTKGIGRRLTQLKLKSHILHHNRQVYSLANLEAYKDEIDQILKEHGDDLLS